MNKTSECAKCHGDEHLRPCDYCGAGREIWLYTGGYAERCTICDTPLLTDEEDRGTCDDCVVKRAYHERMHDAFVEEDD